MRFIKISDYASAQKKMPLKREPKKSERAAAKQNFAGIDIFNVLNLGKSCRESFTFFGNVTVSIFFR